MLQLFCFLKKILQKNRWYCLSTFIFLHEKLKEKRRKQKRGKQWWLLTSLLILSPWFNLLYNLIRRSKHSIQLLEVVRVEGLRLLQVILLDSQDHRRTIKRQADWPVLLPGVRGRPRETTEEWPPLAVELRWMGTQRVQMKGVLLWLVCWACRASTKDFCSALAAPVQFFFLTVQCTLFHSFFSIAQQAGQASVLGRLSLSMCLWG